MDKEAIFAVLEDAEAVDLIDKKTMEELMGLFATRIVSDKAISALKGEKELKKQTRWIPCSKRLPKDGQIVLFCDIDDDIMIGYHVKGRPDTHFSQNGTFEDMKNVRAWMPLPLPYKAN